MTLTPIDAGESRQPVRSRLDGGLLEFLISSSQASPLAVGAGCALIFVGGPLAWLVRHLVGGGNSPIFSAASVLLGIILILRVEAVRRGEFLASKNMMAPVLIPLLCILVLAFARVSENDTAFDGTSLGVTGTDFRQIADTLVLLLFAAAVYSQPLRQFDQLVPAVCVIGALTSTVTIAYAVASAHSLLDFVMGGRLGGFGDTDEGVRGAPLLIAKVGVLTLIACFLWYRQKKHVSFQMALIFGWAGLAGTLMLLFGRSRTTQLGLIFLVTTTMALRVLRARFRLLPRTVRSPGVTRGWLAISLIMSASLGLVLYLYFDTLVLAVGRAYEFMANGAGTFLGNSALADQSALMRQGLLARNVDNFMILGQGYKATFADNPVLTAFYDLGLVGGSAFVLVALIVPLKVCLELGLKGQLPPAVQFAVAFFLVTCPNFFFSLTPYAANNWYTLVFFYAIAGRYWDAIAKRTA